jgi:hypothetical protein
VQGCRASAAEAGPNDPAALAEAWRPYIDYAVDAAQRKSTWVGVLAEYHRHRELVASGYRGPDKDLAPTGTERVFLLPGFERKRDRTAFAAVRDRCGGVRSGQGAGSRGARA